MSEDKKDILDHEYDGIREFDNDLPKWWTYLFILTIVWGVAYALYLHVGPGQDQYERIEAAMEEHGEIVAKSKMNQPASTSSADDLMALVNDQEVLTAGATVYAQKCLACHGPGGGGLVGPNLVDNYWVHGGSITDIKRVIVEGVPAKGMLAWKGILKDDEINAVVAFIWNINGTEAPNAKAPEGELHER